LVLATDSTYHVKLGDLIFDAIEAIFIEKKFGRAEDFKTKIAAKMAYMLTILC
jgi:hypothetical protein